MWWRRAMGHHVAVPQGHWIIARCDDFSFCWWHIKISLVIILESPHLSLSFHQIFFFWNASKKRHVFLQAGAEPTRSTVLLHNSSPNLIAMFVYCWCFPSQLFSNFNCNCLTIGDERLILKTFFLCGYYVWLILEHIHLFWYYSLQKVFKLFYRQMLDINQFF